MPVIDILLLCSAIRDYGCVILGVSHSNLLIAIMGIGFIGFIFCCFVLLRREKKLREEIISLKNEQQLLIDDFENTIASLEQSKEEVIAQNNFIKQLSVILAHDLQSPFRFIKLSMETLHRSITEGDYSELESISFELKQSSEYTYRFITDFTLWLKSIDKDYKPKFEEVNLYEITEELNLFFAALLKSRKNEWLQEVPNDLKVFTDKELLKVIVRNIIDNANKHNFERTIKITSQTTTDNCALIISDNGTGLSNTALANFHAYVNPKGNHSYVNNVTNNKHGHKLIAHFSKLLNLDINVNSKTNTGTTFMVSNLVKL